MFEVFTTLLCLDGKLLWLKEHLERLHRHAKLAGIKIPPPPPFLKGEKTCLVRIGLSEQGYTIQTRVYEPPPQGPVLSYLSDQIATTQLKTNNRAVYDEARKQAQFHGAFEGLLLNPEGYVVDGSRSSLILRQDKTLISLLGGIESITRQKILEHAAKQGYHIKQAYLKPHELIGDLYLVGTGIGLLSTAISNRHLTIFRKLENKSLC